MPVASRPATVDDYLEALPAERRSAIETVRNVVNQNLPPGYEEGIEFGMVSWHIPLSRYPNTYNKRPLGIAALASQKQYNALYLMAVYADPKIRSWFEKAYRASGKKLDMGKSCVRFKKLDDLPLDVIAEAVKKVPVEGYLARYEASRGGARSAAKKTTKKSAPTAKKKTTAATKKKAATSAKKKTVTRGRRRP